MEVYDKIPLRSSANKNLALDVNQLMSNLQAEYLAPSTTLTLTKNNGRRIVLNPSADVDVVMPSTDIETKDDFQFYNISYKVVTFKSSALEVLGYLHNGGVASALPKQATPTLSSHWGRSIINKVKTYNLTYNGGVGTLQDNGVYAIATPSSALTGDIDCQIMLSVSPMNQWWANYRHGLAFATPQANPTITISGINFNGYAMGTDAFIASGAQIGAWGGNGGVIYCWCNGNIGSSGVTLHGPLAAKPTWAD